MSEITLTGDAAAGQAVTAILQTPMDGKWVAIVKKQTDTLTKKQRGSLHMWCNSMANELNDRGFTFRVEGINMHMHWGPYHIKDIFRGVGYAQYERASTEDLTTKETQVVFEMVAQRFSEIYGVYVDWPSQEIPMIEERDIR